MMNRILKLLKILIFLMLIQYHVIYYKYDFELIVTLSVVLSILVVINGVLFKRIEKDAIELGKEEGFTNSYLFLFIFLVLFAIFMIYGISFIESLNIPEVDREPNPNLFLFVLMPQIVESILGYFLAGSNGHIYATENGLLRRQEINEIKHWGDFYSYKLIESHNLIRFKKKNLKYFVVKYDEEYFNDYKDEIMSFLNKKLTRE